MNQKTDSFAVWHEALCQLAESKGGRADDADAWRECYEKGQTPEEAWVEAWGE